MESMKDYVVRRAFEHKHYREVAEETRVDMHWLTKLAYNKIPNPGVVRIERLYHFYKAKEPRRRRVS